MRIKDRLIRIIQEFVLLFSKKKKNVVIIFVPGTEIFSGGILGLFYYFKESVRILDERETACFVCSLPYGNNILHYKESGKGIMIFNYFSVLRKYRDAEKVLLMVGESFVWEINKLRNDERQKAIAAAKLHINVLNMNMDYMPPPAEIAKLKDLSDTITITAAHIRYTAKEFSEPYGQEFTHLCATIIESQPVRLPFEQKKDVLLASHDQHEKKEWILNKIREDLPWLEIVYMPKMKFPDYMRFQSTIKWMITFGEGQDGYYDITTRTGGVPIAVYNPVFFTKGFENMPNVFKSYEDLHENITDFIKRNNNATDFTALNNLNLRPILKGSSPELTNAQLKVLYHDKHGLTLKKE